MTRTGLAVAAGLLVSLGCTEPYPKVGGTWWYASTLTFPADWQGPGGQPYACTYTTILTLSQTTAIFVGTYDSLTVACNTGGITSGSSGAVINGSLAKDGQIGFAFDAPDWYSVGTLHGDSMGGVASDSVGGLSGPEAATGRWAACLGRPCR